MSRGQMVEKAAQAIFSQEHLTSDLVSCREDARIVLDAILPQVTTVAELEALPVAAVTIDPFGNAWVRRYARAPWFTHGYPRGYTSAEIATDRSFMPMTVVWQPNE